MLARFLRASALAIVAVTAGAHGAAADTLYSDPGNVVTSGHPLRLVGDHRASQVGDLVAVQFVYSVSSSLAASNAQKKSANLSLGPGTGLAAIPFFQFGTTYGAASDSNSSKAKSDTDSFSTIMMATVIDVLPSGVLTIKGDQNLMIDGQKQIMHVTGTVRPEDIDNTDTVISSHIANVQASFDGDNKSDHHGLIQKVLDVLF